MTLEGDRRSILGRGAIVVGLLVYAGLLAGAWWAVVNLLPDQVSLHAFGKTKVVGNIHNRIVTGIGLVAAILPPRCGSKDPLSSAGGAVPRAR